MSGISCPNKKQGIKFGYKNIYTFGVFLFYSMFGRPLTDETRIRVKNQIKPEKRTEIWGILRNEREREIIFQTMLLL